MTALLILANKRYHTDFRKYLMRAAERAGSSALHIYCWESVIVSRNGCEYATYPTDVDEAIVMAEVRKALGDEDLIVLTGLGCNEASIATRLQRVLDNATFVYDVYDDLMFQAEGAALIERMLQDAIWRCRCSRTIVLEAGLLSKYPGANHISNASHMRPLESIKRADPLSMVYIGSIDDRLEIGWLRALARQNVEIAIYGRIHCHAGRSRQEIDALLNDSPNVTFWGEYDNDDLEMILGQYRVGLLPYYEDHPMTRHVNPDKLYHYLNAGLEVLAAPIPQARRFADHLHLITTDGDWDAAIRATIFAPRQPGWSAEDNSWDRRWRELAAVIVPEGAHCAD